VKRSATTLALVPPAVLTRTWTTPEPACGDVTVQDVDVQEPLAEAVPNQTEPSARFVPVTVTAVPPSVGPVAGLIPVTVGAGGAGAR
jgi:hypothetical protein